MKVKVSDAFKLQMGKTPSRKNPAYWVDGTADWVSIADLGSFDKYVGSTKERINALAIEESGIKPAPSNTVIMSFKLSIGKTAITTTETYTNEAIMAFIDNGTYRINPEYFFHQFRTRNWMEGTNRAVMGETLNKGTISESVIKIPDASEQAEVVHRLNHVCSMLEFAKGRQDKLDELVKSRFIEMFGDPIGNEAHGPKTSIGDRCKIVTGNTPSRKRSEYYGDEIEWVKTDNINTSGGVDQAVERLSNLGALRARIAPAGSILMCCIAGSVKSIGRVGLLDRQVAFNQQINAIIPQGDCPEYILWLLKLSKDYICGNINMQLKGILNKSTLSTKEFYFAPLALQQQFASFVAQVDKLKFATQQSIDKLQMLYDSLAQEYFGA